MGVLSDDVDKLNNAITYNNSINIHNYCESYDCSTGLCRYSHQKLIYLSNITENLNKVTFCVDKFTHHTGAHLIITQQRHASSSPQLFAWR